MSEREVLVHRRGPVLEVVLNRPHRRNAVDLALAEQLAEAMDLLDADPTLRVGILTGAGGTFCSGMDLRAYAEGERPVVAGRGFGGLVERPPDKPLIASVEGYAVAGGMELALACDLVVAAEDAVFGLPEVKRGLVAAGGGLLRLARCVPPAVVAGFALTGRDLSAREAEHWGIVTALCRPGDALEAAHTLAREVAAQGPTAVLATKQVLVAAGDWTTSERFARQREVIAGLHDRDEALEGARAFAEHRPPRWAVPSDEDTR